MARVIKRSSRNPKKEEEEIMMDNRHFVQILKNARREHSSSSSSSPSSSFASSNPNPNSYRDVYVSFNVQNVHAIDQINQRFHVLFNMYVAWDEDIRKISIPDNDDVDLESMGHSWKKDMFFSASSGKPGDQGGGALLFQKSQRDQEKGACCFDPQIRFTNCMDWNKDEHEEWFRVVSYNVNTVDPTKWEPYERLSIKDVKDRQKNSSNGNNNNNGGGGNATNNKTTVRIVWAQRVQGWFEEDFEMTNFPLDVQHLHIGITSRWDHKHVGIAYDKYTPSTISSQALTSQTFEMCAPRIMSFRDDWSKGSLPLLTEKRDSATGAQYCRAYFALTVTRHSGFVMKNVMLILTLVGFFSFSTFALDPLSLSERQSIVLTLVLTTVAFKYVTMSMMPEIPYLSMLDKVTYGALFLQAFMLLCVCVTANIKDGEMRSFVDWTCLGVLTFWWAFLLLWFVFQFFTIRSKRERYLKLCDKIFDDAFDTSKFIMDEKINETVLPKPPLVDEFCPSYQRKLRSTTMKRKYKEKNLNDISSTFSQDSLA